VQISDFLLRVLFWHLVPSVTTALLTFGFLTLILRLLRVRQPGWQYWIFLIPLLKALAVLVLGAQLSPTLPTGKPVMIQLMLWDPFNVLSVPSALDALPPIQSSAAAMMAMGVVLVFLGALLWRWGSLVLFYHRLGASEKLQKEDAPRVFRLLDRLVPKMATPYPEVIVSDSGYVFPCTLGVRRPAIVLSPELIEESSDEVLESMLAHELAHWKRRDNITHWASVLLRDVLFFNPVAHLIFSRVLLAKEIDCDRKAVRASGKPEALADAILFASLQMSGKSLAPLPGSLSGLGTHISRGTVTKERIHILKQALQEEKRRAWAKGLLVVIAIFALLLNIRVSLVAVIPPLVLQF
jgi:beta-lactamase regulating signal transducer with metallopeptidase domain